MSSSADQQQVELEGALTRFFASNTDTATKRSIEQGMRSFKAQPGAWKQCCMYLDNSRASEFLQWFSATTVDEFVQSSWPSVPSAEKTQVSALFMRILRSQTATAPVFVSSKLIKTVVDMAVWDWGDASSSAYPTFFTDVLSLVSTSETCGLGLSLLKVTSEEFTEGKLPCVPMDRVQQVRAQLLCELPRTLGALTELLVGHVDHVRNGSSNGSNNDVLTHTLKALEVMGELLRWAPLKDLDQQVFNRLINVVFQYVPLVHSEHGVAAIACVNEVLEKRFLPQHFDEFFQHLTTNLFNVFDALASHNDLASLDSAYISRFTLIVSNYVKYHRARMEATSPGGLTGLLTTLYKYTFAQTEVEEFVSCLDIWTHLVDDMINNGITGPPDHITAVVSGFSALASRLLTFVKYSSNHAFLSRGLSLDPGHSTGEDAIGGSSSSSDANDIFQYAQLHGVCVKDTDTDFQAFVRKAANLISHVMMLSVVTGGSADSLLQSTFQEYSTAVSRLNDMANNQQQQQQQQEAMMVAARDCSAMFIIVGFVASLLAIPGSFVERIPAAKMAIQGATQTLAFLGTNNDTSSPHMVDLHVRAYGLIEAFRPWLHICGALTNTLDPLSMAKAQQTGAAGSINISAVAAAAVSAQSINELIGEIATHVFVTLESKQQQQQQQDPALAAAAHCLHTLMTQLRPASISQIPGVQRLLANPAAFADQANNGGGLPLPIQKMLFISCAQFALERTQSMETAPTPHSSTQTCIAEAAGRLEHVIKSQLEGFIQVGQIYNAALAGGGSSPDATTNGREAIVGMLRTAPYAVDALRRSLARLTCLADLVLDSSHTWAKTAISNALQPAMSPALYLFDALLHPSSSASTSAQQAGLPGQLQLAKDAANFLLSCFRSLSRQLGADAFHHALTVLVSSVQASAERTVASAAASNESPVARATLFIKLLALLETLMSQSTTLPKALLEQAVDLIANKLSPHISTALSNVDTVMRVDILEGYFAVVHHLFLQHWAAFTHQAPKTPGEERKPRVFASEAHAKPFFQAMELVLMPLRAESMEPSVVTAVLKVLDSLQEKHHLFSFGPFQAQMSSTFITVLLDSLVKRRASLLEDEIKATLFALAKADFDQFFQTTLPAFASSMHAEAEGTGGGEAMRVVLTNALTRFPSTCRDAPTFATQLAAFVHDLRAATSTTV